MKKVLRIKSFILHKQIFLLFALLKFDIGSAQIKVENELIYNNGKILYLFSRDGKFGIGADSTSVKLNYDSIVVSYRAHYNLASIDGKWGTIGDNNEWRLAPVYDEVAFLNEYVKAKKNGAYGLIYEEDNIQELPFEYDVIWQGRSYHTDEEQYENFVVQKNGKYGIVSNQNRIILPLEFDKIYNWNIREGYYVRKENNLGVVNSNGKFLIPCIYDSLIYNFDLDKFIVVKNGKQGIIGYDKIPFLPISFLKIYVDVPSWFSFEEYPSSDIVRQSRIVVQKIDSTWSYLSLKDGSVLAENVDKDSIFAKYKNEIFGERLMQEYLVNVKGGFSMELDTFTRSIVDYIVKSKADILIDFPEIYKEPIDFDPVIGGQLDKIFKIKHYLSSQGFKLRYGNTEYMNSYIAESPDCECFVVFSRRPISRDEYEMVESLKCAPRTRLHHEWEFKMRRYRDLE